MVGEFRVVHCFECLTLSRYATSFDGQDVNENSCMFHDFYGRGCARRPVHLVVDTSLTNDTLGIRAYFSSPLTIGETYLFHFITLTVPIYVFHRVYAAQFRQLKVVLESDPAEKIAGG